jgi:hypothetical protein
LNSLPGTRLVLFYFPVLVHFSVLVSGHGFAAGTVLYTGLFLSTGTSFIANLVRRKGDLPAQQSQCRTEYKNFSDHSFHVKSSIIMFKEF